MQRKSKSQIVQDENAHKPLAIIVAARLLIDWITEISKPDDATKQNDTEQKGGEGDNG